MTCVFCVKVLYLLCGRRILERGCLLSCGVVSLGSPFCGSDARGSVLFFAFYHFPPPFVVSKVVAVFIVRVLVELGGAGFQIVWEVSWFKYDGLT